MNSVIIYNSLAVCGNGELSGLRDAWKKTVSKVTDVAQDFAKTAVNTVTRPVLYVTGNDPVYDTSDFNTKLFQAGSQIQSATTAAGAKVVNQVIQSKAPGLNTQLPESPKGNDGGYLPDAKGSGPSLSNQQIALVAGGVLLLGVAAYYVSQNN